MKSPFSDLLYNFTCKDEPLKAEPNLYPSIKEKLWPVEQYLKFNRSKPIDEHVQVHPLFEKIMFESVR